MQLCFGIFEIVREKAHLGKIIRGCRERNLEVISDYVSKNKEDNVKQLIRELKGINGSFVSKALLDIIKYMAEQYINQCKKAQFKIGALSGLIYQAICSELNKEVSLGNIVSPMVASTLSDQDAVNLSLVCKSINDNANYRINERKELLTQLEEVIISSNTDVAVGGLEVNQVF